MSGFSRQPGDARTQEKTRGHPWALRYPRAPNYCLKAHAQSHSSTMFRPFDLSLARPARALSPTTTYALRHEPH